MNKIPDGYTRYDTADTLKTEEDIADYLEACNEFNDPALMIKAISAVARARNMTALARDAGLTRPGLYKVLSPDGNPSFENVQAVAKALGLKLTLSVA